MIIGQLIIGTTLGMAIAVATLVMGNSVLAAIGLYFATTTVVAIALTLAMVFWPTPSDAQMHMAAETSAQGKTA